MKRASSYIDIAFCLVVMPLMIGIFPVERWYHNFRWYVLSVGIWLYCLYFINRLLVVPCLSSGGRRRIAGILAIVVSVGVTYAFSSVELYSPKPSVYDAGICRRLPDVLQYRQAIWSLFMIVEAFSFAVGLLTQIGSQRQLRAEAEASRDKARIELYKARIKPHFMFNTLNSLYGLLLDLQSLRLNGRTSVIFETDVAEGGRMVPPMLLVTFVENCFKHGVSSEVESQIRISIVESGGTLHFKTCNRIFPVARIGEHMGVENCRKRLQLHFPGRHRLHISDDGEEYIVDLRIDLNQK